MQTVTIFGEHSIVAHIPCNFQHVLSCHMNNYSCLNVIETNKDINLHAFFSGQFM